LETSLHRALKAQYGPERGGRVEADVAGYRIDALTPDGELVEVQCGALGPLRAKAARLLDLGHRLRVVKPVVVRRRIIRRARPGGPDLSARWSPRRGSALDVFDDLVGLAALLGRSGLALEVVEVAVDEVRMPRNSGYVILDRCLHAVVSLTEVRSPRDLGALLPDFDRRRFTTRDLADATGRPLWFAQKVAYCLRESGAARAVGKVGNRRVYALGGKGTGRPADRAGSSR
jgi:hypothetical protein